MCNKGAKFRIEIDSRATLDLSYDCSAKHSTELLKRLSVFYSAKCENYSAVFYSTFQNRITIVVARATAKITETSRTKPKIITSMRKPFLIKQQIVLHSSRKKMYIFFSIKSIIMYQYHFKAILLMVHNNLEIQNNTGKH